AEHEVARLARVRLEVAEDRAAKRRRRLGYEKRPDRAAGLGPPSPALALLAGAPGVRAPPLDPPGPGGDLEVRVHPRVDELTLAEPQVQEGAEIRLLVNLGGREEGEHLLLGHRHDPASALAFLRRRRWIHGPAWRPLLPPRPL